MIKGDVNIIVFTFEVRDDVLYYIVIKRISTKVRVIKETVETFFFRGEESFIKIVTRYFFIISVETIDSDFIIPIKQSLIKLVWGFEVLQTELKKFKKFVDNSLNVLYNFLIKRPSFVKFDFFVYVQILTKMVFLCNYFY